MPSPITGSTATQQATSPQQLDQRQRLDKVLRQLSEPDSASAPGAEPVDLVEPVKRINAAMRPYGLQFDLHSDSSRVITRIIDMENGEVIRQIPTEEVLRIAERLEDIVGRLISQEA